MSANIPGSGVATVPTNVPQNGWGLWLIQLARAINQLIGGQVRSIGTILADDPPAGFVGEYVSAAVNYTGTGTGVALTNNTAANVTSIVLSPGDWDVEGTVWFDLAATTSASLLLAWTGTTSATAPGAPANNGAYSRIDFSFGGAGEKLVSMPVQRQRINVSQQTTVYLGAFASFTTAGMSAGGFIDARRVR